MYSIAFPDILNSASTNLVSDYKATLSNLKLLLMSNKTSLFGDPYFGTNLTKYLFENNNAILRDLVIDDIYTNIATFMPQLVVSRNDIKVKQKNRQLYVELKAKNIIENVNNLYEIQLTTAD